MEGFIPAIKILKEPIVKSVNVLFKLTEVSGYNIVLHFG